MHAAQVEFVKERISQESENTEDAQDQAVLSLHV